MVFMENFSIYDIGSCLSVLLSSGSVCVPICFGVIFLVIKRETLFNLMQEIESLEVTEKPATADATTDEKSLETVPDCDVENGVGTSEDDLNAPVEPQRKITYFCTSAKTTAELVELRVMIDIINYSPAINVALNKLKAAS